MLKRLDNWMGSQWVLIAATWLVAAGCEKKTPAVPAQPAPEVDVATPVVRRSVEWDEYTGRLAAVDAVDVRSRVTGYLEQIHFKAGQIVKKGDRLFTLDPRPFQAELNRARAEVTRSKAELDHAEYDLKRIEGLREGNVAPEKEWRDAIFAKQRAESDLERTGSEQRIAELNLEWSAVTAPISGRISRELVTVGNLIHDGGSSATVLTTIVSIDPIHCYFDADEQAYLKYSRMSRSGERASSREYATPVHVALMDEHEFSHQGQMDFVDNAMDAQTGTMRGRALLPNPDGFLIPGLFVRVRLVGSGIRPMTFVPDTAIVADQTTRIVYVVDSKNVVHPRPVAIGRLQNGLRRVTAGLDGTETVVVSGLQRARAGATVVPHSVSICTESWTPDSTLDQLATSQATSQPSTRPVTGVTP